MKHATHSYKNYKAIFIILIGLLFGINTEAQRKGQQGSAAARFNNNAARPNTQAPQQQVRPMQAPSNDQHAARQNNDRQSRSFSRQPNSQANPPQRPIPSKPVLQPSNNNDAGVKPSKDANNTPPPKINPANTARDQQPAKQKNLPALKPVTASGTAPAQSASNANQKPITAAGTVPTQSASNANQTGIINSNNERRQPVYNAHNPGWRYVDLPRRNSRVRYVPAGYRNIAYGGYNYRYCNGVFYRPYYDEFLAVAPPFGIYIDILPFGYRRLYVRNHPYYYYYGSYYDYRDNYYYVVAPPVGAIVESLPEGYETIVINGETYYEADGAQYKPVLQDNGEIWYEVIKSNR